MTRSSFSKILLASSLVLLLSMPALAAGHRAAAKPHRARVANPVTEAFRQFWGSVTGALTKEGCGIDPNGRCATGSAATSSLDAGCTIDPSGRCAG